MSRQQLLPSRPFPGTHVVFSWLLILLTVSVPCLAWAGFCPVGQAWPGYQPDWIEPDVISGGGQTFYALFDPGEGCACPVGFQVSTIDFFMTIPDESIFPLDVEVSMGLCPAVPDPLGGDFLVPGPPVCETPVRSFPVPFPKQYLGFGIALECDCLALGAPAFLFFTIHSELDPAGGLYTTGGGTPETGRFFTRIDSQWIDLVEEGILTRGDLVVSGFASCCEPPVAEVVPSWGSLKARYR